MRTLSVEVKDILLSTNASLQSLISLLFFLSKIEWIVFEANVVGVKQFLLAITLLDDNVHITKLWSEVNKTEAMFK